MTVPSGRPAGHRPTRNAAPLSWLRRGIRSPRRVFTAPPCATWRGQLGWPKAPYYNHFDNKDALLLGLFEALGEQTRADLTTPDGASPPSLNAVLAAPLRALAQDNFALFRVVVSEALVRPELGRRFAAMLHEGARLGQAGATASPPLPAGLPVAALRTLIMGLAFEQALRHEDPDPDPDQWADELSEQVLALAGALGTRVP